MPQPPALTDEQRRRAIDKARAVRAAMSRAREDLARGALSLSAVLAPREASDPVSRLYVVKVLESLPGVGKVSARRALEELGIGERRRVSTLGPQQRAALVARFPA
ncbi:MAG: integration host factor, actinobacterial type [Acidimicrobiia bacterium]